MDVEDVEATRKGRRCETVSMSEQLGVGWIQYAHGWLRVGLKIRYCLVPMIWLSALVRIKQRGMSRRLTTEI